MERNPYQSPEKSPSPAMLKREELFRTEAQIRWLGVVQVLCGGAVLGALAVVLFVVLMTAVLSTEMERMTWAVAVLGPPFALIALLLSVTGLSLMSLRFWPRGLGILGSLVSLLVPVVGWVAGPWGLLLLFSASGREVCSDEYRLVVSQTRAPRWRPSWTALKLLLTGLLMGLAAGFWIGLFR
jgi:hypothetical protein